MLLGISLFSLIFLWPVALAAAASGSIVRERERRTWAALLVTPMARDELITVKLASALRWFRAPIEVIVWLQGILTAIVFAVVIVQIGLIAPNTSPLAAFVLMIIAGVGFAFERLQDGAAACLIGLVGSLIGEVSQVSFLFALLGSAGLVLFRLLLTGILLIFLNIPSPQAAILLLATGPTAAIALAVPLPLAFVLLIGLPLGREWAIRRGYRWALAHLDESIGG